ncbi:hypothetical protein CAPTEDRAFT_222188 [Capitella teleta]|uniref:Uncharacterized protein n=1 Tax=Capitella teleta TaxID=283909 RepID=R7UQC3_CAPTE|nr:hypothetical protein CAPTEDRAFT_222188 [Capitella teleta]|eukprot:ELU05591.1 hypothetical protein CAPTEDRAFT_222188 [Capitella teleta]
MSRRSQGSLFIGRLDKHTRTRDLEDRFEKYGRILRCDVKYGAEMAYAFLDFEDHRDAEDALKEENGREYQGVSMVVEWAKGAPRRQQSSQQAYDECYKCHRSGHWARDCKEGYRGSHGGGDRGGGYGDRGGGGGYSRRGGRSRSRSPRRQRGSRDYDRRDRQRSRSRDRKSRSPAARRSRTPERKRDSYSRSPSPAPRRDRRSDSRSRSRSATPARHANGDHSPE